MKGERGGGESSFISVKHVFATFHVWFFLHVSAQILSFFYKFLICGKVDYNYISDCPRMIVNIENWLTVYRKKANAIGGKRFWMIFTICLKQKVLLLWVIQSWCTIAKNISCFRKIKSEFGVSNNLQP